MTELRSYQKSGAAFLRANKYALLADEMRLGKCAQAVAACDAVGAEVVTVICPASVCATWRREFAKWSGKKYELEVWSYDMATKGHAYRWCGADVLILDEAHYLKSPKAKRTQVIFGPKCDGKKGLVSQAERVWALTGTPMPNNPSELWPMLRALAPERIKSRAGKPWNFWQFVKKFCKTQYNPHAPMTPKIVGAKDHETLAEKLDGFMLRRTLAEVKPEVPAVQFDEIYVENDVERIRLGYSDEVEMVRSVLASEGVDGLRKIAGHVATLRRLTGMAKVGPVAEWVKEWLENCDGKIVLFAHHRETMKILRELFGEARCCCVSGDTTRREREKEIFDFQHSTIKRVFIGQIQAAGVGIDLSVADEVVLVESSWVPSENTQAAARIQNLEQGRAKIARFATLAGSIDEDIQAAVCRKSRDIAQIIA